MVSKRMFLDGELSPALKQVLIEALREEFQIFSSSCRSLELQQSRIPHTILKETECFSSSSGGHTVTFDLAVILPDRGDGELSKEQANFLGRFLILDPSCLIVVDLEQLTVGPESAPSGEDWFSRLTSRSEELTAFASARLANFYLHRAKGSEPSSEDMPLIQGEVLVRSQKLRYGENAHQRAAYYRSITSTDAPWRQLQGAELSHNNIFDFQSAYEQVCSFEENTPSCVIVKHQNPCGVASGSNTHEALLRARAADPISHFGGVIAFNRNVDSHTAVEICTSFTEIVVAPGFSDEALSVLSSRKRLRVISLLRSYRKSRELRQSGDGFLIQTDPLPSIDRCDTRVVSEREPSEREWRDLLFAWKVVAQAKSNAVAVIKDRQTLGIGTGHTSRVDATETALLKSNQYHGGAAGGVAASEAFFPFADSVEKLAQAGVTAIVSEGGARRDAEVIAVANEYQMALVHSSYRFLRY